MSGEETLFEDLAAIFAYDQGATDSGIKDEDRRRARIAEYLALEEDERGRQLADYLMWAFLGAQARAEGYSEEDAAEFLQWLWEQIR